MRTETEIRREIKRALETKQKARLEEKLYAKVKFVGYIAALEWVLSAPVDAPVGGTNAGPND